MPSSKYKANFIVIPDIGGLARRLCISPGMLIPKEHHSPWLEAENYIAVVRIPAQAYPFLEPIDLKVPIDVENRRAKLDFKNSRYV